MEPAGGPVALVAGGTGGLGRSPRVLAATGYRFILLGRSDAHARSAEGAFRDAGAAALGIAADILRDGALADAIARGRETFGAAPAAIVWNVGFVPWPAPEAWDPSVLARVARDEARALGSLAAILAETWRAGGAGLVVTVEGHNQERLAGPAPVVAVAESVRGAILERLRLDVPNLVRARVILGAIPSGPAGEGRWLSQDEVAAAVAEALTTRAPRVEWGDLELAARLAERVRAG